jgi:diaminopimelate decarboxylase
VSLLIFYSSDHQHKTQNTQAAPELWFNTARRVITEYGRSLTAKAGWAASRVEYAFDNQPASSPLPDSFLRTAILHVGADALLRECYCPAKFPHRVGVFE